jgi:hypothetical protein
MLAACGEARREEARLAALEAGFAQARASLAALSSGASSGGALPSSSGGGGSGGGSVPPSFRSVSAASAPLAASGLIGAEAEALRRWFGEPDLRRREGEGEVRLYLGPGCALDLVLYASRVAHALARADGAAAVTEADCLRGIGGGGSGLGAGREATAAHSGGR